jgi:hypothetical protein
MGVQVALLYADLHSFGYKPKRGISGHRVVLFLIFWLISIVAIVVYIPTNNMFFLMSSSAFVVVSFLDNSHSHCSEMESQCHFDLHFLYG